MNEQTIALDLLNDSKFCITAIARASVEAANPTLRALLAESLNQSVTEHFQLSDLIMEKGWYAPNNMPMQLKNDLSRAQKLSNQEQGHQSR